MTLDFDTIYAEAQGQAMASGKKRYYDNRVMTPAVTYENGKTRVSAVVRGAETDHNVSILFDEQGGLYDYQCDCPAFDRLNGPCKHIVAAALAFEENAPAAPPARDVRRLATSAAALQLVSEYSRRRHTRRMAEDEAKAELIPVLILNGDRLSLRFTIGRTRQYLLKDISDFVSCMQTGAYRRYGVELSLVHTIESFTPVSQRLIRFLMKSYAEKIMYLVDEGMAVKNRDELSLLSNDVDAFFDIYAGQLVQFNSMNVRDGMRLLVPGEDKLESKLKVRRTEGGYELTTDLPPFKTVAGKNYLYLITDTRIYRLSDEFCDAVLTFLKSFVSVPCLRIAEADMPLFYNTVLTQVLNRIEADTDVDLSVFEAAPLTAKLYLTLGTAGEIEGRLDCSYDDVKVDILDETRSTPDIVRDWESERALRLLLEKYFPFCPDLTLSDEFAVYTFLSSGLSELFSYCEVYLDDRLKKLRVRKPPRVRVGVRLESDLLNLDVEADGFTRSELNEVLKAYRAKRSYIRQSDGSFVNLDDPSLEAISEILEIADAGADGKSLKIPKYYAPFVNGELTSGFFHLERGREFKSMINELSAAETADIEVPEEVRKIMRNYQKTGFRWLKTLCKYSFGGILADDMGLGKSLQMIALILSLHERPSIIVCPTTLILNWVGEFRKFAPGLKTLAVMGSADERRRLVGQSEGVDVIITSYELMRRDEALYETMHFAVAVVDEAQFIKNPETKNARSVKKLSADHRFALTGTPIENSLAELWSIFDFIMPGYLYTYPRFRDRFEADVVRGDEKAAARLNKLVRPFILRRLKTGVLSELPPKVETDMLCPLEDEQQKLYAANLALIKDSVVAAGADVNKVVILSMLTKLRQICCEPRLVYPDYAGNSAKLDACLELIESAAEGGHKMLVFSQFTSMLDILRGKLTEMGISHYILKGDTPKMERMRLVNRFNADDTKVFLISLKAGGTGLNLTGADVVIHYDPWWNESVMNQATDRAYRLGQNKSVQVYKLILENSIEQRILRLQEKKSALSHMVVGADAQWSPKDVLEILQDL